MRIVTDEEFRKLESEGAPYYVSYGEVEILATRISSSVLDADSDNNIATSTSLVVKALKNYAEHRNFMRTSRQPKTRWICRLLGCK